MRTAIIFARKHGSAEPLRLVEGPGTPSELNALYKELVSAPEMLAGNVAEIQLWTSSGGCVKRKKFPAPASNGLPVAENNAAPDAGVETSPAGDGAEPLAPPQPELPAADAPDFSDDPSGKPDKAGKPGKK